MTYIHSSALIDPTAVIHPTARIGPFCIVEAEAVIGAECVLESQVRIYAHTHLGQGNRVSHGVTLGSAPQDLSDAVNRRTPLVIGDYNQFRENVNISCGIKTSEGTRIGHYNYFMAFSHVGHDCRVGDHNILANTATLAGHVELAHHIFISGQVAVHQFCRIGAYVMIGGLSGVAQDVPPFIMVNGQRAMMVGLNNVGLRRHGFNQMQRSTIKAAYRLLYASGLNRVSALIQLREQFNGVEIDEIIRFIEGTQRGLVGHVGREKTCC